MAGQGEFKGVPIDDEPPPYVPQTEPMNPQPKQEKQGIDLDYVKSIPGIIKIIQMVLVFLAFICCVIYWTFGGGGFVQWVTISAFISTLVLFILKAFHVVDRFSFYWELWEFIYLIVYDCKLAIAAIIAATRAHLHVSIVLTCVLCVIAAGFYILDTIQAFKAWQAAKARQAQPENHEGPPQSRRVEHHVCIIF